MTASLELRNVTAGYGPVSVLRNLSITVPAGSLVSIVGPNGAGKTTLLRVASGLLKPTSGSVLLGGRKLSGRRPHQIANAGVCLIPEGRGIFPALTVRENLVVQASALRTGGRDFDHVLEYFPRLGERLDQLAGTMSGGEQQMLAMARAIMGHARVLLLDEISMGLAPLIVEQLFDTVESLRAEGITILLVEQYLSYPLKLSDLIYVLGKGTVRFVGEPGELTLPENADLVGYGTG